MDIMWENPPEKRKRAGKWEEVFNALRANPGRWAKLSEGKDRNSHSLAGRLRTEYNGDDEFEIISQTTEAVDGVNQAGVWARYISPADPGELETVTEMEREE